MRILLLMLTICCFISCGSPAKQADASASGSTIRGDKVLIFVPNDVYSKTLSLKIIRQKRAFRLSAQDDSGAFVDKVEAKLELCFESSVLQEVSENRHVFAEFEVAVIKANKLFASIRDIVLKNIENGSYGCILSSDTNVILAFSLIKDDSTTSAPDESTNPTTVGTSSGDSGLKAHLLTLFGEPPAVARPGEDYIFTPETFDSYSYHQLRFSIQNKPKWLNIDEELGLLSGKPELAQIGSYPNIILCVSDAVSDKVCLKPFSIEVKGNRPPTISGDPTQKMKPQTEYLFIPQVQDPENDPLTFTISKQPSWASFDATTGQLSGTPALKDIGKYEGISISVSDRNSAEVYLDPFSIEVIDAGNENFPPVITGNPASYVRAGSLYTFTPTAIDAERDQLEFLIENQPVWATFDANTGTLQGTPTSSHVGVLSGVRIGVLEKRTGASPRYLLPFSIEVLP
ncbi:MAG: hypothetical protein KA436_06900 [Oligoflexales bacterium]|nr:hypothetical protein [Oligoflexales bacterium]